MGSPERSAPPSEKHTATLRFVRRPPFSYLVPQALRAAPSLTPLAPSLCDCDCFVWKKKSKVYNKGRTVSADFHLHTFSYILVKIID